MNQKCPTCACGCTVRSHPPHKAYACTRCPCTGFAPFKRLSMPARKAARLERRAIRLQARYARKRTLARLYRRINGPEEGARNGVVEYDRHGNKLTFCKGDRLVWKDPSGIGGAVITGTFYGAIEKSGHASVVAIVADPSESLRSAIDRASRSPWFHSLPPGMSNPHCGLSGYGGTIVITGDAFHRDVYDGRMTLATVTTDPKKDKIDPC